MIQTKIEEKNTNQSKQKKEKERKKERNTMQCTEDVDGQESTNDLFQSVHN